MPVATPTPVTALGLILPVLIALMFIGVCSLVREPARRNFSAIFVAGAGAAYLSGGFGVLELVFCAAITVLAYRGLSDYRATGVAWLLHSGWDLAHDLYGNPIIPFVPDSSFGCFVCDPVIALWYLTGAPNVWGLLRKHHRSAPGRRREAGMSARRVPAEDLGQLARLRIASVVETGTLASLVLVAVPLKHLAGWDLGVRALGPLHGLAFVAFIWISLRTIAADPDRWPSKDAARLILLAFVPLGGLFNLRLLRRKAEALGATAG